MAFQASTLHAYLDGALSEEEQRTVQRALEQDDRLRQELIDVKRQRENIDEIFLSLEDPSLSLPPLAPQLDRFYKGLESASPQRSQAPKKTSGWTRFWLWGGGFVTAMAAVTFLMGAPLRDWNLHSSNTSKGSIAKGTGLPQPVAFEMWYSPASLSAKTAPTPPSTAPRKVQFARDRSILHAGDLVQFRYQISKQAHGMIVSINQRGEVFPFVPFQGKHSQLLSQQDAYLPQRASLELDDYVGPERFFFVISKEPFSFETLRQALQECWRAANKDVRQCNKLPKQWSSQTFLIEKRAARQTH